MPMSVSALEADLRAAFPDAEIAIDDLAGDGDHYRARIVSQVFVGLPRVRQHQLVYAALRGKMGGELHALALETSAPGPRED
jgi:stress-induced morphogen